MAREFGNNGVQFREIAHPEISSIFVYPTPEAAAAAAGAEIIDLVNQNPTAAITYATGNTMIPLYGVLAEAAHSGKVDFSGTTAFHLDAYYPCGSDPDRYPHSFVAFLRQRVFGPLGISRANVLNGMAPNPEVECQRYDKLLLAQPIALAILGIGPWSDETGKGCHMAFNESGTPFETRVHVQELDQTTIERDVRERGQAFQNMALTQGPANIIEAQKKLLLAFGGGKSDPVYEALRGPIGPQRPASALRLAGQKVTVYLDEAAASRL